jgi:hypothetical protein
VGQHGEAGVVHGSRGTPSNRKIKELDEHIVVTFLKEKKHTDFGPTFAQEQLEKQKKMMLGVETIRSIMIRNGLHKPRRRKDAETHREWRERKAMRGEMLQFDGCYHHWLEDDDEQCMLAAIDDATSDVDAQFEDNEGVHAVFRFWWSYILKHGRPVAIYLDKFSTYKVNHPNAVDNEELMTQFRRAMTELDIRVICANSPQAKGRIERLFNTLQNRLVKELRLAGITTIEAAKTFLKDVYLPSHNARFSIKPRTSGDAHRPLSDELRVKLPSIFSVQSLRRVNNDFTIRFKNVWYQLGEVQNTTVYRCDNVTIEERLDGSIHLRLRDVYLEYIVLPERPKKSRAKVTALTHERQYHKPADDHPWKKAARAGLECKISRNAR